jgi:hypothetical protein
MFLLPPMNGLKIVKLNVMDNVEKAIFLKFLNYSIVTMNWFVKRIEKKYASELDPQQLEEVKVLLKKLEIERDELEKGI